MLKTRYNGQIWCVSQPDHGAVAGFLAAHWGNREFHCPGHYAQACDQESLREEVVLGIAQHDNGWWEWEASPEQSDVDGLPLGLDELLTNQRPGMDRWRRGIPRLREAHPYASLLTSFHAYWLYAPRCREGTDPAFLHPLFWNGVPPMFRGRERDDALAFLDEVTAHQQRLTRQLTARSDAADGVRPEHLDPHVRLLQLLDGLSLSLCSGLIPHRDGESPGPGRSAFTLSDVPRGGWADRVSIDVRPAGDRRVSCDPYPFDTEPLRVSIPARIFAASQPRAARFATWWHATAITPVSFEVCAG